MLSVRDCKITVFFPIMYYHKARFRVEQHNITILRYVCVDVVLTTGYFVAAYFLGGYWFVI